MTKSFDEINSNLKQEAANILIDKGLMQTLQGFGHPHVSGSYALDLMVWRDLDIYLEVNQISVASFFKLGSALALALSPPKMNYRNELIAKTPGLPEGLYWGIHLGEELLNWKIDVWMVLPPELQKLLAYGKNISDNLTPDARLTIMKIKSACWQDPAYRRTYTSADIYQAALHREVKDVNNFLIYLKAIGKK